MECLLQTKEIRKRVVIVRLGDLAVMLNLDGSVTVNAIRVDQRPSLVMNGELVQPKGIESGGLVTSWYHVGSHVCECEELGCTQVMKGSRGFSVSSCSL